MEFPQPQTSNNEPPHSAEVGHRTTSSNAQSILPSDENAAPLLRQHQDHQRKNEAQAAYASNAEVPALTPRTSANVWGGNSTFSLSGLENDARITTQPTDSFSGASIRPGQSSEAGVVEAQPSSSTNTDPHWQPSLAVGSIDAPNLGAKEAARRHMLQWEHIQAYNRLHHPSADLQIILERLASARTAYERLCHVSEQDQQTEASLPLVQQPSHQREQIERRIALLQRTLLRYLGEEFAAMRRNITAALEGYNNGEIGFSDSFTLIYAGRIVDRGKCKSWVDFTVDRQQRLNQYCQKYGEGYLWWEPPLLVASGSGGSAEGGRMLAKKGITVNVSRADTMYPVHDAGGRAFRDGACHYKVPLGFKKDDSLRCRHSETERAFNVNLDAPLKPLLPKGDNQKKPPDGNEETQVERKSSRKRVRDEGQAAGPAQLAPYSRKLRGSAARLRATIDKQQTEPKYQSRAETGRPPAEAAATTRQAEAKAKEHQNEGSSGPTVFFNMVLDSGAELPLLLYDDLKLLGFDAKDFNAASVIELDCAGGLTSESLTFELLAGLELHDQPANNAGRCSAFPLSTFSSAAVGAAIHHHIRSPESHFFPSRILMLGPEVTAPPYGGFSTQRLSGILPFLAYYTASAPGNGQMAFAEERVEVLGRRNMPFGMRYDPFDTGHGGDHGERRQQQQVKERIENAVTKIGGAHLGMQKVKFEYAMEHGHVLVEQDAFSRDGRRITTTVTLVEQDGTMVREYRCTPAK